MVVFDSILDLIENVVRIASMFIVYGVSGLTLNTIVVEIVSCNLLLIGIYLAKELDVISYLLFFIYPSCSLLY